MTPKTNASVTPEPIPEEELTELFRPALKNAPAAAEQFGRLLAGINESLESEPGARGLAIATLSNAIDSMFPYSETYLAARDLWEFHLRGLLFFENEPDQLLKPAIEQGAAEARRLCSIPRKKGRAAGPKTRHRFGSRR